MYSVLLTIHSLVRWLVLISLLVAICKAYKGWLGNEKYTRADDIIRSATVNISHLQMVLGIGLYCISPVVRYFMSYFKKAVHEREIRFFGMEHITMMLIAIVLITVGSAKAKRQTTDRQRFRIMAIWFTIALIIIFASIPWHFSPFTRRPYFRWSW
jgi:cell division protein FtsW (lipid II flippase)